MTTESWEAILKQLFGWIFRGNFKQFFSPIFRSNFEYFSVKSSEAIVKTVFQRNQAKSWAILAVFGQICRSNFKQIFWPKLLFVAQFQHRIQFLGHLQKQFQANFRLNLLKQFQAAFWPKLLIVACQFQLWNQKQFYAVFQLYLQNQS